MPSTLKKLPNEPIVILTLSADYDWAAEVETDDQVHFAFFDSLDEPVDYIVDTSAYQSDLSTMIQGSNRVARGENAIFQHPNIRSVSIVTQSDLKKLAARGMDSDAFGHVNISVFKTLDEALAHVREMA